MFFYSKEEQKSFLEILKRNSSATEQDILNFYQLMKNNDNNDDDGGNLDYINLELLKDPKLQVFSQKLIDILYSDDHDENEIKNYDQIWFNLTKQDRDEFIHLVNSNSNYFDSLLINQQLFWIPWWNRMMVPKNLENNINNENSNIKEFPNLYNKIEQISKLTSVIVVVDL